MSTTVPIQKHGLLLAEAALGGILAGGLAGCRLPPSYSERWVFVPTR